MHPTGPVVTLADAFRTRDLPVVIVTVTDRASGRTDQKLSSATPPADWAEVTPELNVQSSDHKVSKKTWGAFTGTGLGDYLNAIGVIQVVIAGIATSTGVESTARQAHEAGLNVTIATDAMTDTSLEAHENSITRIFPRLAETSTSAEIIAQLV